MELTIKGRPEEVAEKSEQVLERLHDFFLPIAPELADTLRKAMTKTRVELRHPVLKTLQKKTAEMYDQQIEQMLTDVNKVLNRSLDRGKEGR